MKVSELFEDEDIDEDFLTTMEGDSEYWDSSVNFIKQNWNRAIDKLSDSQQSWMNKILEDCVEKRIEG